MIEGTVIRWNGEAFAFRPKQAGEVEDLGLKVWANGDFQSYCENSRAYVLEGEVGQSCVAKINGKWQRAEILRIDSPVDIYVEGKETLERKVLLMINVKKLTQELSMICLATIKCKMLGVKVEEQQREKFIKWRSSVLGPTKIQVVEKTSDVYKVHLFKNEIMLNLIATMEID